MDYYKKHILKNFIDRNCDNINIINDIRQMQNNEDDVMYFKDKRSKILYVTKNKCIICKYKLCFGKMSKIVCGHKFCTLCITKWANTLNYCPICY